VVPLGFNVPLGSLPRDLVQSLKHDAGPKDGQHNPRACLENPHETLPVACCRCLFNLAHIDPYTVLTAEKRHPVSTRNPRCSEGSAKTK
jgi:hypothetical protein